MISKREGVVVLLIALSGLVSGCAVVSSSQVDPSTIYTQYSASLDADTGQMKVQASFYVGGSMGTYVVLDGQSSVSVDGHTLSKDQDWLNVVTYRYQVPASDPSTVHLIVYTDSQGRSYQNPVVFPAEVSVAQGNPSTASLGAALELSWESAAPGGGVSAILTHAASPGSSSEGVSAESLDTGTKGVVLFTSDQLSELGTGEVRLKFCRGMDGDKLDAPQAGGSLAIVHCGRGVDLQLD